MRLVEVRDLIGGQGWFESQEKRHQHWIANAARTSRRLPDCRKQWFLAISNLGSPILAYSGHRSLPAPITAMSKVIGWLLDAHTGSPDEARAIIERHRVGIVAVCPGNGKAVFSSGERPTDF